MMERIDLFSASLPKKCIYCAYGYPVVFGAAQWLEVFACGAHLVENLRSKRTTLDKSGYSDTFDGAVKNLYMPMVGPSDSCDCFRPIRLDGRGSGFVNARKFYLLDSAGLFDEMGGDAE